MVVVHCAYSEPINPTNETPVLTRDQIWKGLQRKIRKAQDFVPVIYATDVIEEKDNEVVRDAHFGQFHDMPPQTVREVCKSYYPTKVDFWQTSGALITNTISDGPGLTDDELHMTYTFEWRYPDVEEGSDKHKELMKQHREGAKTAVHSSIVNMRKMAAAGELD
ncbi:DUF1857-domain-containing protein [Polychaeton citri CBS 116435]|uniref:DUF1857-domain-containing protein n=1 Tax=Polychaeton citri CBS 116435 TaxID=1314669 RepID=A0A9P4UJQ7_9PEZI|nr:DUF1857-domain-containing protein [Polychaeton citri CBS 116435]